MAYLHTNKLGHPLECYRVNSYRFKQACTYGGMEWGVHLGEDVNCRAGTRVKSIGMGRVVYSALHAGTAKKPNWGNIIIIAHKHPKTKRVFFSLYGHLGQRLVKKGQSVEPGQTIGVIAKPFTPQNGWWEEAHLHFAIYTGKWKGRVLPGYWKRGSNRTKLSDWKQPSIFIREY